MPILKPQRIERTTYNVIRSLDAHLDHAFHRQIDRLPPAEKARFGKLLYAVAPDVDGGRLVLRVQTFFEGKSTATIMRDLDKITSSEVWDYVTKAIACPYERVYETRESNGTTSPTHPPSRLAHHRGRPTVALRNYGQGNHRTTEAPARN